MLEVKADCSPCSDIPGEDPLCEPNLCSVPGVSEICPITCKQCMLDTSTQNSASRSKRDVPSFDSQAHEKLKSIIQAHNKELSLSATKNVVSGNEIWRLLQLLFICR